MNRLSCFIIFLFIATSVLADEQYFVDLLKSGSDEFSAKMFSDVAKANSGRSFVISAFSVMTPIAQLALASVGESHDELLASIGMPNNNATKEAFLILNSKLKSSEEVIFKTASKIYVAQKEELKRDFMTTSRYVFDSEVEKANFVKNIEVAKEVNTWVEQQTNERIKNLVDPDSLNENTKALIVNAIYFKAPWYIPFEKDSTENKNFYIMNDQVIQIPTMHNKGYYMYAENEELNAQLLEIPYKGNDASIIFILPRDIDGITKLIEKLTNSTTLINALNSMSMLEADVYIPKFKIETTTNLKHVLKQMNVQSVFTPGKAKLENLLENYDDFYVSDAIQKAFIEINEDGTEAAAANDIGLAGSSLVPQPPPVFNANRPFFFLLRMNSLPLFSGIMHGSE